MSHRGRLNVMAQVVGRSAARRLRRLRGRRPEERPRQRRRQVPPRGDRHLPDTPAASELRLHLVSNPSHLEAVDPVALGRVRAKQRAPASWRARTKVMPDPAPRRRRLRRPGHHRRDAQPRRPAPGTGRRRDARGGQQPDRLHHASPRPTLVALRDRRRARGSRSRSSTSTARTRDAVVRVARMALDYRYAFGGDVVVDLVGYRRYGHSEVDDPTVTQPLLYSEIKKHPPLRECYAEAGRSGRRRSCRGRDRARVRPGAGRRARRRRRRSRRSRCSRSCRAYWDGLLRRPLRPVARRRHRRRGRATSRRSPAGVDQRRPTASDVHPKVGRSCSSSGRRWRRGRAAASTSAWPRRWPSAPAAGRGRARATHRPGQPARHVQPAPRGADRRRGPKRSTCRSPIWRQARRVLRGLRLDALRGRGAGLRVRLQPGLSRRRWSSGRRSSATSPTAPRSSSTSS